MNNFQHFKNFFQIILLITSISIHSNDIDDNEKAFSNLMFALESGNKKQFEKLLKNGLDINITGKGNDLNLLLANTDHWSVEDVEYLISKGINIKHRAKNGLPLFACFLSSLCMFPDRINEIRKITTLLEKNGYDIYEQFDVSFAFGDGVEKNWNSLIYMVDTNIPNAVEFLLTLHFDINYADYNKMTALHHAVYNYGGQCMDDNSEIVMQLLLSKGAETNRVDINGNTPLILAARNNSLTGIKKLLKYNADINKKNNDGNTALIIAIKNKSSECAEFLIKQKADINIKNKLNQTALEVATEMKNTKIMILLLEE
ncbi:MAG: ankyrin repeat domain-containing protein [Spirochaetes bacterium]|nr:ankyrin repeat domain-containing protein [Spirochaetota bacterium]